MAMRPDALLFDVFGTVVDWRGSLVRELARIGAAPANPGRLGRVRRRVARGLSAGHGPRSSRRFAVALHRPVESRDPAAVDPAVGTAACGGRNTRAQCGVAPAPALGRQRGGPCAHEAPLRHRHAIQRQHVAADRPGASGAPAVGLRFLRPSFSTTISPMPRSTLAPRACSVCRRKRSCWSPRTRTTSPRRAAAAFRRPMYAARWSTAASRPPTSARIREAISTQPIFSTSPGNWSG